MDGLCLRSPYFIFPDEKRVKGSSVLFFAILDGMIKDSVIAVAAFKLSSVSRPRLVAMIPQKEEIDEEDGIQILPGGMHLILLPWREEMRTSGTADRKMIVEAKTMVTTEMMNAVADLSKKWQFEETSGRPITGIENPSIQCFYSGLQAIALNEPSSEWGPEKDDQMKISYVKQQMQQEVEECFACRLRR